MKNNVMLITYADSLGENLSDLKDVLDNEFMGVFSSVHILPFYPSSGDRGFAPITYKRVDSKFGSFEDLKLLSKEYDLMYDFMVNHISAQSSEFKEFDINSTGEQLFIKYSNFYNKKPPSKKEIDLIYKRKPELPFLDIVDVNKNVDKVWSTFSSEQIDIDVQNSMGRDFITENLRFLAENGAKIIRLDAFAYAIKKRGTSCFFVEPETSELLEFCSNILEQYDVEILPEIHEHFKIHKNIEKKGFYTYDFALPMMMLHTIYSQSCENLLKWFEICPRNQFTTLDTHDGIGVVDVTDLLSEQEIKATIDNLYEYGANTKKVYSSKEYANLDVYQINCTYYSALGNNDDKYLLSRAIQMYAPGIPQVYYVGALSGENDLDLLEKTKEGRNINRHYYSRDEITKELKRDINMKLVKLLRYRNENILFNGEFNFFKINKFCFEISYKSISGITKIEVNLQEYTFKILENDVMIRI